MQANLLAATARQIKYGVYNVAVGAYKFESASSATPKADWHNRAPTKNPFEPATYGIRWLTLVLHPDLEYLPTHTIEQGLDLTVRWYQEQQV